MIDYIEINIDGKAETVTKLDAIKHEMTEYVEKMKVERQENLLRKKPLKIEWNRRLYNRLALVMRKIEKPMPNSAAQKITGEQFNTWYDDYCELCCWIEDEMQISYDQTKPEYCNFCGITGEAFEYIKLNGDKYQVEALNNIDTLIANGVLMAAEKGEIKANPAQTRLSAKSPIGHRMQTVNNHEVAIIAIKSENSFTPRSELEPPKYKPQALPKGGD